MKGLKYHANLFIRDPDKVRILISVMPISSPTPMVHNLLEPSHLDNSNKWSNIGFGDEITQGEWIEVHFTHLLWSSDSLYNIAGIHEVLILAPIDKIMDRSKTKLWP